MRFAIRDSSDPILASHHYETILPSTVRPEYCAKKLDQTLFQRVALSYHETKSTRLTVGMATYNDYDGVYFTIQSLRLFHSEVLDQVSFLIIDNNPLDDASVSLRHLASKLPNVRYLPFTGITGTAAREQIFNFAESDWVLCLDSHVMLVPGSLKRLIEYIDCQGDPGVLLQGPLLDDRFDKVFTHFEPEWHDGMYGDWATDERGVEADARPFEIEMQGLGLFACNRHAWPGLNRDFRGFGGEEGYLHEKFRRAGGKTLCLPFLRWIHRFKQQSAVPYKMTWEDRVRNYLLAFQELGWDAAPLREHFSSLLDPALIREIERSIASAGENNA
jgi:hypothetical protein